MKLTATDIKKHRSALIVAVVIILLALLWPTHRHPIGRHHGDIAGFTRDCVTRVLQGDPVKSSCQSLAAIQSAYQVDAAAELAAAQGARSETARRIARGDLTTNKQYRACVDRGQCAEIALVPDSMEPHSAAAGKARAEFWHLVNSGSITADSCDALPLCQAMVRLHLITPPPPL